MRGGGARGLNERRDGQLDLSKLLTQARMLEKYPRRPPVTYKHFVYCKMLTFLNATSKDKGDKPPNATDSPQT